MCTTPSTTPSYLAFAKRLHREGQQLQGGAFKKEATRPSPPPPAPTELRLSPGIVDTIPVGWTRNSTNDAIKKENDARRRRRRRPRRSRGKAFAPELNPSAKRREQQASRMSLLPTTTSASVGTPPWHPADSRPRGRRPDLPDRCPRAGEPPSSPAAAATTPQAATSKPGHGRPAADPERGAAATPSQRQQQQPAPHAPHPHATPTSQRQRQAPTQPAVGGGPPGPDRARKPRRHAAEQLEDAQPTTQPPGTRTRGPCRAATPHASAASRPGAPPRGSPPREEARGAPPPPTLIRLRPGVPLGDGEGGSREGARRRRR